MNFRKLKLKDIASEDKKSIISGPFGSDISSKFFQEIGVPVIRGNNLSNNVEIKFKDEGFAYLTENKADELNAYAIKNDLIFTAAGTIGQVGLIEEKSKYSKYVISNKQIRVRLDLEKVNPFYAYYWFSSPWVVKDIVNKNTGSTVPLINLSIIKDLEIKVPFERNYQDKIAFVLSTLDSKIELNNRINAELEAMAKTLYDYWFVQFDFPNEEGKPYKTSGGAMVWNEELKREVPEGWEVGNIEKYCSIIDCLHSKKSDLVYENENSYLLQLENIKDNGLIDLSNKYYVTQNEYKKWTTRVEVVDGDIVITNAGRVAATAQIPLNVKAGIGRNITAIRSFNINPTFLFLSFSGIDLQNQIKLNTDSGAFFTSLNVKGIKKIQLLRPNKYIEDQFEKIVFPIRRKREQNNTENQKLSELRDWLLPMLMNGQVKVV